MNNHEHVLLIDKYPSLHKRLAGQVQRCTLICMLEHVTPDVVQNGSYHRVIGIDGVFSDQCIQMAKAIHAADPVSCIVSFNELYQEEAARVAAELKIDFLHNPGISEILRHKIKTRECLRLAGLDDTPCRFVAGANDIEAFMNEVGVPIIVKPEDANGSTGVTLINGPEDIRPALSWFNSWAPGKKMIAEKFIKGQEYSVECFSEDGVHKRICIVQKFKNEQHFVGLGHRLPAILTAQQEEQIVSFVTAVLDALGLKNGPSHTEVILSGSGPKLVETHSRVAGAKIPYMLKKLLGVDIEALWLRQFLGEKVLHEVPDYHPPGKFASIWFTSLLKPGILMDVKGVSDAEHVKGIDSIGINKPLYSTINTTPAHSNDRLAYAIALDENSDNALMQAQNALSHLEFVII